MRKRASLSCCNKMTAFLPPSLLALFAPREPLMYFPPLTELPWDKKPWPYTGVAQYLSEFEDVKDTPAPTRAETRDERRARKRHEREERYRAKLEEELKKWDPTIDHKIQGDPFKTLFIGRINFDTSEAKLRREFESYGPVRRINIVLETNGKPRGYAFVEYENERDMHSAYKYADGKKIDGKRVVVDVERGRTVKSWRPRRLGGGLGGSRKGAPHECIKYSGRVDERDMDRERDRDKDRDRDRDRDKDRGERDKERGDHDRDERRRDRDKGKERERDKERRNSRRSRSRDRDRDRRRGRSRSRDRDKKDRSRSRERHKKDKKKDKDRKDKDKDSRKDRDHVKKEKVDGIDAEMSNNKNGQEIQVPPLKEEPMEA